ncbi:MAG: hypothetical protein QE278_03865 [Limnobacter sp.]|nr:hypothetical protein [Limnobacter sp.]
MKSIKLQATAVGMALVFGASLAFAQQPDVHDLKPVHGGVVSQANHKEFELVIKPDSTQLHVRDHGKPMDLSQASAKLTVLDSGQKQELTLTGQGALLKGNGVQLKGSAYTAVATVEFANKKKTTVRFKVQ